ncbi:MAG TPA: N-acetylmuramoyl-L-alanine amidase, partial [Thermoleophilia bacterium]|nr:N-acetylmuramoyl-L-alanine amidase [Thermoleophilia bacterium]
WSDVPVVLPEIGFMTNRDDDRLLSDSAYQDKIAQALADAALRFLQERAG